MMKSVFLHCAIALAFCSTVFGASVTFDLSQNGSKVVPGTNGRDLSAGLEPRRYLFNEIKKGLVAFELPAFQVSQRFAVERIPLERQRLLLGRRHLDIAIRQTICPDSFR
jgi:hypothetical protein